jgi:hypothetical protein
MTEKDINSKLKIGLRKNETNEVNNENKIMNNE